MYQKPWIPLVCLSLALLLSACGEAAVPAGPSASAPETPAASAPAETPAPTPEPAVELGGESYSLQLSTLRLQAPDAQTLQELCEAAPAFLSLQSIDITDALLQPEQLSALREAFPEAELKGSVALFGQTLPLDTETLDLRSRAPEELDLALLARTPALLPSLREIDLRDEPAEASDGQEPAVMQPPLWPLETLCRLREQLDERVRLDCRFSLFGQTLDSSMSEIVYEKAGLQEGALDEVRQAFSLLPDCSRFVLDNCGPSYEQLDALREEYPEKGVVWRVHFRGDSLLTDEHVLWSNGVADDNCDVLNYCHEIEYIDIGHDGSISTISFTAHMPHLKVLIIAQTGVSDLSPLANCPELEYLEIFGTNVRDLSPLTSCTELEHLNISTLFYLRDITPLYELKKLQRLWIINSGGVSAEQLDEFERQVPGCHVQREAAHPTDRGWRRDIDGELVPRYALLREQFGYEDYYSPNDKIDWDKAWKPGYA